MSFSEKEILNKLDLAFEGRPASDYPIGNVEDIKYNFFLDLEHGYCVTASSRIHLYADTTRWAIVFEKCGYQNRGGDAEIELNYVGNCIDYPVHKYPERSYITNSSRIELISSEEYERIRNKDGKDMDDFELISPTATDLSIHGRKVPIDHDIAKYLALGIKPREYHNPRKLIGYDDIVRFFSDTNPELVNATEDEIKQHIPKDMHKIMTLDKFHFVSFYDRSTLPGNQETYQLIAKVLVTRDTTFWKPNLEANNHWSNWESGAL
ncbi:hypothetical protein [Chitinophaga sp. 212800010-3]|uniref:DUF7003 family protein n=1 Tax=unclassified Chitinophaga TaxID=2619133 RepID=UPI002E0E365F